MHDFSPSFLLLHPLSLLLLLNSISFSNQILTIGRLHSVSTVRRHFRPYSYYPHSTLIMFGIEASVPTNSDGVMSSCAVPTNFYCTIHLRPTYLQRKQTEKKSFKLFSLNSIYQIQINEMFIFARCSSVFVYL